MTSVAVETSKESVALRAALAHAFEVMTPEYFDRVLKNALSSRECAGVVISQDTEKLTCRSVLGDVLVPRKLFDGDFSPGEGDQLFLTVRPGKQWHAVDASPNDACWGTVPSRKSRQKIGKRAFVRQHS